MLPVTCRVPKGRLGRGAKSACAPESANLMLETNSETLRQIRFLEG